MLLKWVRISVVLEAERVRPKRNRWLQKYIVPSRHSRLVPQQLTETAAQGTGPAQVQARWSPSARGRSRHVLPSTPRAHLQPTSASTGKPSFLPQRLIRYTNHTYGPVPSRAGKHKISAMVFLMDLLFACFTLLCLSIFYLFGLLLWVLWLPILCFYGFCMLVFLMLFIFKSFPVCFLKREKEGVDLDDKEDSFGEDGRGETTIRIYYMNFQ